MAMGLPPPDAPMDPVQEMLYLMMTRYINGAAFVVLLYDHLLSLGSEVALIWPTRWSSPKVLYLIVRYVVPCTMVVFTIQLAGLSPGLKLSDSFCSGWMSFGAFMGFCTVSTSNFLILLRLWVIWDRNRTLVVWSLLLFILAQFGGLATTSYVVWRVHNTMYWNPDIKTCAFHGAPPIAALWAPGTAFEVVLCAITWWNALTQPRTVNAPMAVIMYRDGFLYFLLLLGLRIINTILAATAPSGLIFVAMLPVWCAVTTTTCRLMLALRQIEHNHNGPDDVCSEGMGAVAVEQEYDELARSGVHVEMLRSISPPTPMEPRRSGWGSSA
ncbi:hypothetical protein C8R47DRAFT_1142104 [Mycena vitilis]|nr:hypothetical protein C8R47DRAFT_1142104 [Mycena vitilis]